MSGSPGLPSAVRSIKAAGDAHGFGGVVVFKAIALLIKCKFLQKYHDEPRGFVEKIFVIICTERFQSLEPFLRCSVFVKLLLFDFCGNPNSRLGFAARHDGEVPGLQICSTGYIVPLIHDAGLLGFVVLSQPESIGGLNYEDHDLLRTAGQQIAGYLAQELSTEQLAESRQFEAFNRLTAYIMHDLKNLIAQQSLMVENAEKHKSNPAFIDDAMSTIRGSVARMRRVIENLQQGSADRPLKNVDLGAIVTQAVSDCSDRRPLPQALIGDEEVWVRAERERMLMALCHAIRNAQEATPADGEVRVELKADSEICKLKIVDSGLGMDDRFIRERLFKPFDSTKGTKGMGMGAYQIRETVRLSGGELSVESVPGKGTRIIIILRRLLHAEHAELVSAE